LVVEDLPVGDDSPKMGVMKEQKTENRFFIIPIPKHGQVKT